MAGLMMSLNGAIVVFGQGVLIRFLIPALATEGTVALFSYGAHALLFFLVGAGESLGRPCNGLIMPAAAPTGEAMIAAICIAGVPSALGEPAIKSVMAHLVPADEQGALQGVMGSVYTLAQVISPLCYSALFRFSISKPLRDMCVLLFLRTDALAALHGALSTGIRCRARKATCPRPSSTRARRWSAGACRGCRSTCRAWCSSWPPS
jgi:hypothetical protein